METSDKPWPDYERPALREHYHAIGVIVANWQAIEDSYRALFQVIGAGNVSLAFHAFDLLGNDSRAEILRAEFCKVAGNEFQEPLDWFLKASAICKENRNGIAHASYGPDQDPAIIRSTKGLTKDRSALNKYRFTLAGLREMADAARTVAGFGMILFTRATLKQAMASGTLPTEDGAKILSSLPSPPRLPLPRKWYLHSQALPEDEQPPPEPSQGEPSQR